jgi:transcriptional regulator with XRE-family HTH domain
MARTFPHYLRSERKRGGLSQHDVAALLNTRARTVRHYEQSHRLPPLETALAYEAVFGVPVAELFPGLYAAARKAVRMRARRRAIKVVPARTEARRLQRRGSLLAIASR